MHLSARRIESLANRNLITDENYARRDVKVGACATLYPTPFIDINLYFIPSSLSPPFLFEEPRLLFHSVLPFPVFSRTIVSNESSDLILAIDHFKCVLVFCSRVEAEEYV